MSGRLMAHILVIDDDLDVRVLTLEILEAAGHHVTLAANGLEGIEAYRQHLPDVVLTDLVMPEKEGIETIAELKRECPGVRIIAMSGGGRPGSGAGYLSAATAMGVGAVLCKPFASTTLLAAIDRLLAAPDASETP
jgi:CheY-like chemotaxis protein